MAQRRIECFKCGKEVSFTPGWCDHLTKWACGECAKKAKEAALNQVKQMLSKLPKKEFPLLSNAKANERKRKYGKPLLEDYEL